MPTLLNRDPGSMVDVPAKEAPRLFLIDAYALIYRAYYAFVANPLVTSKGEQTSAVFGFTRFLTKIREEFEPDYLAVVFDAGTSEREERYPEYKATREKMPEELEAQLPRVEEVVGAFNDAVVRVEGYEADDVIGTLAVKAAEEGLEAVIVSGDKDFHQMVREGIHLLNPGRGGASGIEEEWVDERNAGERLGVPPEKVVDLLALMGDSSDNIPGAPGIGEGWAKRLLIEIGELDELLEDPDEVPWDAKRRSLRENEEQIRLSKELVTIRTDVPVDLDLEALEVREPDTTALRDLFLELEFHGLLEDERIFGEGGAGLSREGEYHLLTDPDRVAALVEEIREEGRVSVDTETTSLDPMRAELVGISLAREPGTGYYLPFGHRGPRDLLGDGDLLEENLPAPGDPAVAPLVELLEDPEVEKVGQNLKYDLNVLRGAGVELRGIEFDTMVASYVIDPGRRQNSLDTLSLELLGHRMTPYEEVCGKGKSERPFSEVPLEEARDYAAEDADITLRISVILREQLEESGLGELFRELEVPLVRVLADMERAGIRIDEGFFEEMGTRLQEELSGIEEEIYQIAGGEFNINSTPQLREVLFEELELPVIKRTKTGPSTDASVLEELAGRGHRIPILLLEYRQISKLRSTYVEAIPKLVNPETGRVHTSFNQTVAATGRLSSSDPNLQNIPIRTPLGREIRKGFIPADGHLFFGADYSQIELRILAHFSGDPPLVEAFREGIDVHRQTASVVFGVDIDEVTPEMRARAKTINFATLYGQGDFSLGRQLGISREEAREFIDEYFERFSGVRDFLDRQVEAARERGYVETLIGRRRRVPELDSSNWNVRQFGERVAQNTPIQGTAADLIKRAMIEIHGALEASEIGARMLLQVHDELLFEVPEGEVDELSTLVVEKMEGALELDVPLKVDTAVGGSWYECKG